MVKGKVDDNRIRPYNAVTDARDVKMLIGQGIMEGLARANKKVYTHPVSLVLWLVLGVSLDYYLDWLPSSTPLSTFTPLIGLALVALPFLVAVEYIHRPAFTRIMRKTLGAPDLVAIEKYYHLGKRSGCLVFDRKGEVGGVICWDGLRGCMDLGTVLGAEEGEVFKGEGVVDVVLEKNVPSGVGAAPRAEGLRQRKGKGKTFHSDVVEIRHLDVDHPYRRKGIATELLSSALDEVFGVGGQETSDLVIVQTNPVTTDKLFTKFGFVGATATYPEVEKAGLLSWQGRWLQIDRQTWLDRRRTLFK